MRRFFFLFFVLLQGSLLYAQKASRATEAYLDGKYEKATQLYMSALSKDSGNIIAQAGLAKSIIKEYKTDKFLHPASMYIFSIRNLQDAAGFFIYADPEDVKMLAEKMSIFSAADILTYTQPVAAILWNEYYSKNRNADSVQYFYNNYCFGDDLKSAAFRHLATLSYENAQKKNTIADYQKFIAQFPASSEVPKAKEAIERLEISDALAADSKESLEKVMNKYPASSRQNEIKDRLAAIYYKYISLGTEEAKIKTARLLLKSLGTDLSNLYADSCHYFLFIKEYKNLSQTGSKNSIRKCLRNYENLRELNEYKELINKKLSLIFESLSSPYEAIDYTELHEFITEAPSQYPGTEKLFEKVAGDLNERCKSLLDKAIDRFVSDKLSVSDEYKSSLQKVLKDQYPANFRIDTVALYNTIKLLEYSRSEEYILNQLIKGLNLTEQVKKESLSIKAVSSDWSILTLREKLSSGIYKKKQLMLGYLDDSYSPLPELKTTPPIYGGIKRKYAIASFSNPEIISMANGQYLVEVYGYSAAENLCCPGNKFVISYETSGSTLVPLSLKSQESFSLNIFDLNEEGYYPVTISLTP